MSWYVPLVVRLWGSLSCAGPARLRAGGCGGLAPAVVVALRATSLRFSLREGGCDGVSSAPERRTRFQPSRRSSATRPTSPRSTAMLGVRRCASAAARPQPCSTDHCEESGRTSSQHARLSQEPRARCPDGAHLRRRGAHQWAGNRIAVRRGARTLGAPQRTPRGARGGAAKRRQGAAPGPNSELST